MLKKKLFIFLLIFLALPLATAYVCQDVTDPSNIPCEAITPYIEGNCTTYNYTITNLTNNSMLETGNMTPVGDGTYNFTFNYSTKGDYGIVICSNHTSTLTVASTILLSIAIIIMLLATVFVLFFMAFELEEDLIPLKVGLFIVGFFFMVLTLAITSAGVAPSSAGIANMVNIIYIASLWISLLIVAYVIVAIIYITLKSIKTTREKTKYGGLTKL